MTTLRQAAQQPAKGNRSESGGIRLYLSPRAEQRNHLGGLEERGGGTIETKQDAGKQMERKSLTSGRGTQVAGRNYIEQGRGSPTIGRGRKLPERNIPNTKQHSPSMGKVIIGGGQDSLGLEVEMLNMERMEKDQGKGENKGGDTQKGDTLMVEHNPPEPVNSKILDASPLKENSAMIERGTPLLEGESVTKEEKQALAGRGYSTDPSWEKRETRSPAPRGEAGEAEKEIKEIKDLLRALPTKTDIQQLISTVEQAFQQAVENLKEDTKALGHRVESLEDYYEATIQAVTEVQDSIKEHEDVLNLYKDQLDDYENRDRRQNIRIKGLSETIQTTDLTSVAQKVFCQIMGTSIPESIEIDRIHRVPTYSTQNREKARDVICRLHKYTIKETIMRMARSSPEILFDGMTLSLYPDLTRRTLFQRRAVRPLLEALRLKELNYRWGFPFSLTASRNGRTATLRTKDDLQSFVETLDLPAVDFTDWRTQKKGTLLQRPEQWHQVSPKAQRRNRYGRHDPA